MANITYSDKKDLPALPLHDLFCAVGWSDGSETPEMLAAFSLPFHNSTFVFSAWDADQLIGCVRVLSDKMFRSIVYDLAVHPSYQQQGVSKELLRLCIAQCPDSEWLVQTGPHTAGYYEAQGFARITEDLFLRKPGKWF